MMWFEYQQNFHHGYKSGSSNEFNIFACKTMIGKDALKGDLIMWYVLNFLL